LLYDLKGDILTFNYTNYSFIKLPSGHVTTYMGQFLFEIKFKKGLATITLHTKRNTEIKNTCKKVTLA